MVLKYVYSVEFPKVYQPAKFSAVDCLGQALQRDYKNTMMTSLWRHFIILGFKIFIFCETSYKQSICKVSNPSVIWMKFYRGFYKTPQKWLWRHFDVSSQYLTFRISHVVELNRRYQSTNTHLPMLSGSNFTRAGGKHPALPPPPHSDLQALKKPSPYRVKLKFGAGSNFWLLISNRNSETQYQFEILRKMLIFFFSIMIFSPALSQ